MSPLSSAVAPAQRYFLGAIDKLLDGPDVIETISMIAISLMLLSFNASSFVFNVYAQTQSGPATSGSATSGPYTLYCNAANSCSFGGPTSGPATSGSANSGPATSGSANSGPATSGSANSGPATSGSANSGPATSDPSSGGAAVEVPPVKIRAGGPHKYGGPCTMTWHGSRTTGKWLLDANNGRSLPFTSSQVDGLLRVNNYSPRFFEAACSYLNHGS